MSFLLQTEFICRIYPTKTVLALEVGRVEETQRSCVLSENTAHSVGHLHRSQGMWNWLTPRLQALTTWPSPRGSVHIPARLVSDLYHHQSLFPLIIPSLLPPTFLLYYLQNLAYSHCSEKLLRHFDRGRVKASCSCDLQGMKVIAAKTVRLTDTAHTMDPQNH